MNKKFSLLVILFFLFNLPLNALIIQDCSPGEIKKLDLKSSEDNIPQCAICEGAFSTNDAAFFQEFEEINDEKNVEYLTKKQIKETYPDRGSRFCEPDEEIYVGSKNLIIPPQEDSVSENENSTSENTTESETNNNSDENKPNNDPFLELENDMKLILKIINEKAIQDSHLAILYLSDKSKGKNPVSFTKLFFHGAFFTNLYFDGMLEKIIEKPDEVKVKTFINLIEQLKYYNLQKEKAKKIYLQSLFNCGDGSTQKYNGIRCDDFLITTYDDIKYEENFNIITTFFNNKKGFLDNENDNVFIVPYLIEFVQKEINFLKEKINKSLNTSQENSEFTTEIQKALYTLGFMKKNQIDGEFGSTTQKAIDKWRKQNKFKNTGPILKDTGDHQTLIKQKRKYTKEIQKALSTLGFMKKNQIDGEFGSTTQKAIDKWRKQNKFKNTGPILKNTGDHQTLIKQKTNRLNRLEKEKSIKPKVKEALEYLGYTKKWISWLDKNSKKAIEKWQKKHGYKKTGSFFEGNDKFNKKQYQKLIKEYNEEKNKDNNNRSKKPLIQSGLRILGFYEGDNVFGKETIQAIKHWESINDKVLIDENDNINDSAFKELIKQATEVTKSIKEESSKINEEKDGFKKLEKPLNDKISSIKPVVEKLDDFIFILKDEILALDLETIEDKEKLNTKLEYFKGKINQLDEFEKELNVIKNSLDGDIKNSFIAKDIQYKYLISQINKNSNKFFKNSVFKRIDRELPLGNNIKKINTEVEFIKDKSKEIEDNKTLINEKAIFKIAQKIESFNKFPLLLKLGIIGFVILIVGGGVYLFIYKKQKSRKDEDEAEKELQIRKERLQRESLEKENLLLKENIEKEVETKIQEKINLEKQEKILTPEEQEVKTTNDRINEYKEALLDVSFVDNFQKKWEAMGLKEDQVINHNKERTLTIDNRNFSKTNFWALPYKGRYIIFAGRTLRSNVAALTANDSRWAKEIFEGIFEIVPGDEFFTKSVANADRVGDVFTISKIGVVYVPSRNN